MYGYHHRSWRSIIFYIQWFLGKKSDGESYREIRDRFLSAQAYLAKYPNDARVVIVSHAVFINLFVAHICDARSMSPLKALKVFKKVLTMPNADVVELSFEKDAPVSTCAWSVIS
jgi:broad specificity phosphatase PhoE